MSAQRLLDLLKSHGPMNVYEMVILAVMRYENVRSALRLLRDPEHPEGKRVFIIRYDAPTNGKSGSRRPVYAAGNKEDATEGSLTKREVQYRYRQRHEFSKKKPRPIAAPNVWKGLMK